MLDKLDQLFESQTIMPSFSRAHAILALYLFAKHPEGLGRYRLKSELNIGSGTARSLVNKFKKKLDFIRVSGQRKGHVLTEKGKDFLKTIKAKIPSIKSANLEKLKDVIIDYENRHAYLCFIKDAAEKVKNGMEQRDAAIKIGGLGASCLVYDGEKLNFSLGYMSQTEKEKMRVSEQVQNYFQEETNGNLKKNDVIIIGIAETAELARLAAFNSALTLLKKAE
ncbi:MAG: DUF4443 domain-containing protein [Promethearchaeia archaeon]